MRCPVCGDRDTRVVDSRDLDDAATIRRRRECSACSTRFTTYERVEAARLVIVNAEPTPYDDRADEVVREPIGTALPQLLRGLREPEV